MTILPINLFGSARLGSELFRLRSAQHKSGSARLGRFSAQLTRLRLRLTGIAGSVAHLSTLSSLRVRLDHLSPVDAARDVIAIEQELAAGV